MRCADFLSNHEKEEKFFYELEPLLKSEEKLEEAEYLDYPYYDKSLMSLSFLLDQIIV